MLLWVFKDNDTQVDLKANFHISVNFFLLRKNLKLDSLQNTPIKLSWVLSHKLIMGYQKARYSARHSNFWDGHLVQP